MPPLAGPNLRPMWPTCPFSHDGCMNPMYLLYAPVAAAFVVFVIYGGLVLPAKEIAESVRDRARTRDPNPRPPEPSAPTGTRPNAAEQAKADPHTTTAAARQAEVINLPTPHTPRKAAA